MVRFVFTTVMVLWCLNVNSQTSPVPLNIISFEQSSNIEMDDYEESRETKALEKGETKKFDKKDNKKDNKKNKDKKQDKKDDAKGKKYKKDNKKKDKKKHNKKKDGNKNKKDKNEKKTKKNKGGNDERVLIIKELKNAIVKNRVFKEEVDNSSLKIPSSSAEQNHLSNIRG